LHFLISFAFNVVTGLPYGGPSQNGDALDGFSAQFNSFSAESIANGSVLLKWDPISGTIV
jgi:hypothetical protein